MTYKSYMLGLALNGLDKLQGDDYKHIVEYIKTFDNHHGFMFTIETSKERIATQSQMNKLLDDGSHSGSSFGCMMRIIQLVLSGYDTRESLIKQIETEETRQEELEIAMKEKEVKRQEELEIAMKEKEVKRQEELEIAMKEKEKEENAIYVDVLHQKTVV